MLITSPLEQGIHMTHNITKPATSPLICNHPT